MTKTLSIILPTYNERLNVIPLLDKIHASLMNASFSYEVLFIDDSTDDTPQIITRQMQKHPEIRMIHRIGKERTGLATAFIMGFNKAQGKYICCMDSDLQHPPETILLLAQKAIKNDSDIVVATRYIEGGSAAGLGGLYRRMVSIGIKYFTQIIFIPARLTTDPGSGFFLFKKTILAGVTLEPKGFKILIEILMRTNFNPAKVHEIPYAFLARENDISKANFKQGIIFFTHIWHLFRTVPEAGRFIKFCIIGASGILVNIGTLAVLKELIHLPINLSWSIAFLLSVSSNFFFNSFITYGDKKIPGREESLQRITYYYVFSALMAGANFAVFRTALHFGIHYIPSALMGIAIATMLNFLILTKFIWKLKLN